jgi:hypothetical protein
MKQIKKNIVENFKCLLKPENIAELSSAAKNLAINVQDNDQLNTLKSTITSWLANLKLLDGVPFSHLVSHETMLPVESIRFFSVDNNWVTALIDGAFSIGTVTHSDSVQHAASYENLHKTATNTSYKVRSNKLGKDINLEYINKNIEAPNEMITGFLLRSIAVSAFPGLQVEGYDDQSTKLNILRFEHLSQDILLCLFAGKLNKINLHAPPEALHFGFNFDQQGSTLYKKLRVMANSDPSKNGKVVDDVRVENVLEQFARKGTNIIKIKELADAIKNQLKSKRIYTDDTFTSAEFAMQMVESQTKAEIRVIK